MQISPPTASSVFPELAGPIPSGPADPLLNLVGIPPADSAPVEFKEFLLPREPASKPQTTDEDSEGNPGAIQLAAPQWMNGLPSPPVIPPGHPPAGDRANAFPAASYAVTSIGEMTDALAPSTPTAPRATKISSFSAGSSSRALKPSANIPAVLAPSSTPVQSSGGSEVAAMASAVIAPLSPSPESPLQPGVEFAAEAGPGATPAQRVAELDQVVVPVPASAEMLPVCARVAAPVKRPGGAAIGQTGSKPEEGALVAAPAAIETTVVNPISARVDQGPLPFVSGLTPMAQKPQEKSAAAAMPTVDEALIPTSSDKKDFLKPGRVAVSAGVSIVGIGVAQQVAAMSVATSNRPKSVSAAEPVTPGLDFAARLPVFDRAGDLPAPVAALRETMAAVFSAVEALEPRGATGRNSVDLQFRVGDERLAVRVELRDGTVHTTFRTDSSDLRNALSQEWLSVMQPEAAREIRLAEPVFSPATAGGGDPLSGSLGQGMPQRQAHHAAESPSFFRGPGFAGPDTPAASSVAPISIGSNQLLNAFA